MNRFVCIRQTGLDLLSLDGSHAVGCWNASASFKEVRRFLRMARWVHKAGRQMCMILNETEKTPPNCLETCSHSDPLCQCCAEATHGVMSDFAAPPCKAKKCTVVTSSRWLPEKIKAWLQNSDAEHRVITMRTLERLAVWKGMEMR